MSHPTLELIKKNSRGNDDTSNGAIAAGSAAPGLNLHWRKGFESQTDVGAGAAHPHPTCPAPGWPPDGVAATHSRKPTTTPRNPNLKPIPIEGGTCPMMPIGYNYKNDVCEGGRFPVGTVGVLPLPTGHFSSPQLQTVISISTGHISFYWTNRGMAW